MNLNRVDLAVWSSVTSSIEILAPPPSRSGACSKSILMYMVDKNTLPSIWMISSLKFLRRIYYYAFWVIRDHNFQLNPMTVNSLRLASVSITMIMHFHLLSSRLCCLQSFQNRVLTWAKEGPRFKRKLCFFFDQMIDAVLFLASPHCMILCRCSIPMTQGACVDLTGVRIDKVGRASRELRRGTGFLPATQRLWNT